jgi:small GTP-binding protein
MTTNPTYNIAIYGNVAVGKSSYIRRLIGADFIRRHTITTQSRTYTYTHRTHRSNSNVTINLIDTNCYDYPRTILPDCHAVIIMFDVTSLVSYRHVPQWYRDVRLLHPTIPIVILGNKADAVPYRTVLRSTIRFHRLHRLSYYDISSKHSFNIYKPIDNLLLQLQSL